MTRNRRPFVALLALTLLGGSLAAAPARAQAVRELVDGVEVDGAYLVHSVTESEPPNGGSVVVDTVDPFDPDGGLAIFEPNSADREVFTYRGVSDTTSELTGVVRTAPSFHPNGAFVQAIDNASPSPKPSESPSAKPRPRDRPTPRPPKPSGGGRPTPVPGGTTNGDTKESPGRGFGKGDEVAPQPRSFSTTKLVSAAAQLTALGWSEKAARRVYRPFPVAGPATFTNTWGALRYGPAPGQIRGHEGQDIFCDFGAPILAVTDGRIQFDTNGLGGRIARLRMSDGSYWYYAHLSGWNRDDFRSGDRVEPGDVIGYCGHSGDAKTTPNHLHFGWYSKKGRAADPMRMLVGWLRTARQSARSLVVKVERRLARTMRLQMLGRMFGDEWAPDLEVVSPSGLEPATAGTSPSPSSQPCDPGLIAPPGFESPSGCAPAGETGAPSQSTE